MKPRSTLRHTQRERRDGERSARNKSCRVHDDLRTRRADRKLNDWVVGVFPIKDPTERDRSALIDREIGKRRVQEIRDGTGVIV